VARVRLVNLRGIISTVAGGAPSQPFPNAEGALPTSLAVRATDLAIAPDRALLLADANTSRVLGIAPSLPGLAVGDVLLAAPDGGELYVFDSGGQHQRTLEPLTGALRLQFGYDGSGRLTGIADPDGNVTTIERDGTGTPTAIVSPYAQRTALTSDGNGYLTSVTDPAGGRVGMVTRTDGLLEQLLDARGGLRRFEYDALGRLTRDSDAVGRVMTLARTETPAGFRVVVNVAGQTTTYTFEATSTGVRRTTVAFPGGAQAEFVQNADGSRTATYGDGTVVRSTIRQDPRWGLQAPLAAEQTATTPGGRVQVTSRTRTITLADPVNPFSILSLIDTVNVNGRTTTSTYTAATRTVTLRSPAGRTTTLTLDARGRTLSVQSGGLAPLAFT
jgi:YD repeat-containing protein